MVIRKKRRYPRAEIQWPTTILTNQGHVAAKLINLGAGGVAWGVYSGEISEEEL